MATRRLNKNQNLKYAGNDGAAATGNWRERMEEVYNLATNLAISRFTLAGYLDSNANCRNIAKECGYPTNINPEDYLQRYRRNGLARRVCDIWPDECFALNPTVYESDDTNENTEFEQAWKNLTSENDTPGGEEDDQDLINVIYYLHLADRVAGRGRYAVLFLGLDDGKPLSSIVPGINERGKATGQEYKHKLLYMRVFDETQAVVKAYENDTNNPRFGQPKYYTIRFRDPIQEVGQTTVTGTIEKVVHWSRCIHVCDGGEVFASPRMEPVYNWLLDFEKVLGGSAEMFYKGGFPGTIFTSNPQLGNVTIDEDALRDQYRKYQEGLQRMMMLVGMEPHQMTPQIADPEKHIRALLTAISITMGIPLRVLMGTEESKLSSTQDALTWNKRVGRRQAEYLTPMLIRPFVKRLIIYGVLPRPKRFVVEWPDLNTLTDDEKAGIAQKYAMALATYVSGNVEAVFPLEQFCTAILKLSPQQARIIAKQAKGQSRFTKDPAAVALEQARLKMTAQPGQRLPTPGRGGLTGGQVKKPAGARGKRPRPSGATT